MPAPQFAPSASGVHADVEAEGWQVSQALAGFDTPAVYDVPPMTQPPLAGQAPALHCSPDPHAVPSGTFVHALVETEGWQLWHGLLGFAAPLEKNAVLMKQPDWQVPPLQTAPAPQLVPSFAPAHGSLLGECPQ
jgi:hypothetical protein